MFGGGSVRTSQSQHYFILVEKNNKLKTELKSAQSYVDKYKQLLAETRSDFEQTKQSIATSNQKLDMATNKLSAINKWMNPAFMDTLLP